MAATLDVIANTGYPHGTNTGLLWAGRGVQARISAGASFAAGPLRVGLYPELAYHANAAFTIMPFTGDSASQFAYPWWVRNGKARIDWPQRFGADPFFLAAPGQSFVSLEGYGVRGGISTENLWWGPALRQSIILGNEAAGFPHAFLGTADGWKGRFGRLDTELIWGLLSESDYYDDDPENDRRLLTGMVLAWQPPVPSGLSLGLARVFYQRFDSDSLSVGDFVPFFSSFLKDDLITEDNPFGRDAKDQLIALYARYAIPRTGFELYAEFARNDYSQNFRDLVSEPDHTRGYTLGFQQVIRSRSLWYRLRGEMTTLGVTRTSLVRSAGPYYVHGVVDGGYTHDGQLLGAGIGPGSDAQYLGFDILHGRGRHGLHVERVRYDDDAYYRFIAPQHRFHAHDVELSIGTEHVWRWSTLELSGGVSYSSRRNRNFRYCNPDVLEFRDCRAPEYRDSNWHIPVGVTWRPRRSHSER